MDDSSKPLSTIAKKPNLLCNFRAPTQKEYDDWLEFKEYVKDQGSDVCRVTLGLIKSFMTEEKAVAVVKNLGQNVTVHMHNDFNYMVAQPKREPFSLNSVKPEFRRTFSSILFEAYVLDKARRKIKGEFSFRDFLELDHHSFRRIIVRLRRKGLVVADPVRSLPRLYMLTEDLEVK